MEYNHFLPSYIIPQLTNHLRPVKKKTKQREYDRGTHSWLRKKTLLPRGLLARHRYRTTTPALSQAALLLPCRASTFALFLLAALTFISGGIVHAILG